MKENFWKQTNGKFLLEREALNLSFIYYKEYRKYSRKYINTAKVKDSKYWQYFIKTIEMYGSKNEWNANKYIESVFYNNGKVFPAQLMRKDFWDNYVGEYRRGYVDKSKSIAYFLLSSYKKIEKWNKNKGNKVIDYENYIKSNLMMLDRMILDPYFLSISKSFKNYYFTLDMYEQYNIRSPDGLESNRRSVFTEKKILAKMKEILGDEFDGRSFL